MDMGLIPDSFHRRVVREAGLQSLRDVCADSANNVGKKYIKKGGGD